MLQIRVSNTHIRCHYCFLNCISCSPHLFPREDEDSDFCAELVGQEACPLDLILANTFPIIARSLFIEDVAISSF